MAESTLLYWVELTVTGIEILAISIIVVAIVGATTHYLHQKFFRRTVKALYQEYIKKVGTSDFSWPGNSDRGGRGTYCGFGPHNRKHCCFRATGRGPDYSELVTSD
jgi:hypothetical protein